MTTWNLDIRLGWRVGLGFIAILILLMAGMVTLAVLLPISLLTYGLGLGVLAAIAGAVLLGYQLSCLVRARYTLDRNAVIVQWGGYEYQIPVAAITEVMSGEAVADWRLGGVVRWPGYCVGRGNSDTRGEVLFHATVPVAKTVVLKTAKQAYAISPQDREGFLKALEERREMGATQDVEETSRHPAFLDWEIWRDRVVWVGLGGSMLVWALLLGVLCWRFPALPPQIVLRVGVQGEPLLAANAVRIFYMSLLGIIFLLLNGGLGLALYSRVRVAAYGLWLSLLALQGGLWIAVLAVLLNTV